MLSRLALAATLAAATPALADDEVKHVDHLVVVTPNAPVVVTEGDQGPQGPQGPATSGPVMTPTMNGAPQNEDWNNVSHINGVPVKVGERGDYLYKFRRFNIAADPISWVLGMFNVSASYALSDNIVLRGDVNFGKTLQSDSGSEFGVSLPIYFRRAYSGPFIEPGLVVRSDTQTYYDDYSDSSSMSSHVLVEMMVGWHWTFDSGLNLALAAGVARPIDSNSSDDDVTPAGYFRVGYAF